MLETKQTLVSNDSPVRHFGPWEEMSREVVMSGHLSPPYIGEFDAEYKKRRFRRPSSRASVKVVILIKLFLLFYFPAGAGCLCRD